MPGRTPIRRSHKRKLLVIAGVLAVALVGFVGLIVGFGYYSVAQLNRSVPADAWIGECYSKNSSQRTVDCSGPHHYEVYSAAVFDRDADYPGWRVRYTGLVICEDDFEAYTGESYFRSPATTTTTSANGTPCAFSNMSMDTS